MKQLNAFLNYRQKAENLFKLDGGSEIEKDHCVILFGNKGSGRSTLGRLLVGEELLEKGKKLVPVQDRPKSEIIGEASEEPEFNIFPVKKSPNIAIIDSIAQSHQKEDENQKVVQDAVLIQHAIKYFRNNVSFVIVINAHKKFLKYAQIQSAIKDFLRFFTAGNIDSALERVSIVLSQSQKENDLKIFGNELDSLLKAADSQNKRQFARKMTQEKERRWLRFATRSYKTDQGLLRAIIKNSKKASRSDQYLQVSVSSQYIQEAKAYQILNFKQVQNGMKILQGLIEYYAEEQLDMKISILKQQVNKNIPQIKSFRKFDPEKTCILTSAQCRELQKLRKNELVSYEILFQQFYKIIDIISEPQIADTSARDLQTFFAVLETGLEIIKLFSDLKGEYMKNFKDTCCFINNLLDLPTRNQIQQSIEAFKRQEGEFKERIKKCSSEKERMRLCFDEISRHPSTHGSDEGPHQQHCSGSLKAAFFHLARVFMDLRMYREVLNIHLFCCNFGCIGEILKAAVDADERIDRPFLQEVLHRAKDAGQFQLAGRCLNLMRIKSFKLSDIRAIEQMRIEICDVYHRDSEIGEIHTKPLKLELPKQRVLLQYEKRAKPVAHSTH